MLNRTFVLRDADAARALWSFLHLNWRAAAEKAVPLAIEVREHRQRRSSKANRLYWQRLNQIAQDAWVQAKQYSPDLWHAFFASEFIGTEEMPSGKSVPISTASLNVEEFAAYLTRVEEYATTELGIELF